MDLEIKGKIALVTAGSKGLGRASAEELSQAGCRVAICARTTAQVEATAREIFAASGHEVLAFSADMSKEADINRLLDEVRGKLGDPEILVINAGGPPAGNYDNTPIEEYPKAIELTLMSGVRLTHGCLPAMRKAGWGRIVMISSISVKQPLPFLLLSNMARAGLTGFMKTVASEIAASGVTVNAVLPGSHLTDRIRSTAEKRAADEGRPLEDILAETASHIPMRRIGEPRELAALVAFLASGRSSFITGTSTVVDGGAYAGLM
ncbi:MAG: SDR family oxidoreductase [SAR324 cluster bacterium]|nr:SDR family oxidoreductase [SAR324 cluster bacterium]